MCAFITPCAKVVPRVCHLDSSGSTVRNVGNGSAVGVSIGSSVGSSVGGSVGVTVVDCRCVCDALL